MPSLGIAPIPGGAPAIWSCGRRDGTGFRRFPAGVTLPLLEIRVEAVQLQPYRAGPPARRPYALARPLVSWHAIVPFTFRILVSHQTQEYPPNSSRLSREYNKAPRGAARSASSPMLSGVMRGPSATAGDGPLCPFHLLSRTGYLGTVRDADSRPRR